MTEGREKKSPDNWMVRRPLQIERIREEISDSEDLDASLHRLQRLRENVDAVVYTLSNQDLADDRRKHLLELLLKHREALDAGLVELGFPGLAPERPPLWYFNQLEPVTKRHLASILGIPEEPAYYEVLDIKAEEYIAQYAAFEFLAEQIAFKEVDDLVKLGGYAALILTLSGSLIQLSEPLSHGGSRRYIYQNIYGNTHPPEGVLVLDSDVRLGHRLRSVELTTSPVRLIRTLERNVPWDTQTKGFKKVARTLTSLASRSNSQLVESGWLRSQTGLQRQVNPDAAERVYREDNRQKLARFQELRELFLDRESAVPDMNQVEAELLALCHFLQSSARELDFPAKSLGKVRSFTTEEDRIYRTDPLQPGAILLGKSGKGPEVMFSGGSLGRQVITTNAPLAFVGADGGLMEVTPLVTSFTAK